MKKIIVIAAALLAMCSSVLYAHKRTDNTYKLQKAYEVLENDNDLDQALMTSELSMVKAAVEKEYIQFYIAAPERNYANLEQNIEFYIQQLIKASQRCREIFDTLKDEISKTECNE